MDWVLIYWLANDPTPYFERDIYYGSQEYCEELASDDGYDRFLCAQADGGAVLTTIDGPALDASDIMGILQDVYPVTVTTGELCAVVGDDGKGNHRHAPTE